MNGNGHKIPHIPSSVLAAFAYVRSLNDSQPKRFCDCEELLDEHGKRHPAPYFHDCDYVRRRNGFIPQANHLAAASINYNEKRNGPHDIQVHNAKWTRAFSKKMDELSKHLLKG